MLRALTLNHAPSSPATPVLSYSLLVLGICAALGLGLTLQKLAQQRQRLETDLSQMRAPVGQARNTEFAGKSANKSSSKDSQAKQAEISAVQSAMHELALPWPQLFQALESLRVPDVRLASIEPNPRQRKLRISADTGEVVNMFTYVHQLAEQPIFNDVLLVSHELHTGQETPVRFIVEAVWVQR